MIHSEFLPLVIRLVWWMSQFMLLRNKFVISPSWPCSASSIWRATWRPQIPLIKRESSASRALATRVWKTCARASPSRYLRNLWPIKGNIYAAYKPHATKCSTPQTPLISNKYTKILYACTVSFSFVIRYIVLIKIYITILLLYFNIRNYNIIFLTARCYNIDRSVENSALSLHPDAYEISASQIVLSRKGTHANSALHHSQERGSVINVPT